MELRGLYCMVCTVLCWSLSESVLKDLSQFQDFITTVHNFYRSYERAADMKELKWDSYLQSRAEQWSENCYWDHQRDGLGENLAYFWTNGWEMPTMEIILKSCQNWWKEVNDWHWSTDCGQACHYTQMIWGNTERIGCALSKCANLRTDSGRTFNDADFFVCFYDPPGNFIGKYPYTFGEQCTKCSPGDTCNGGLCSSPVVPLTPPPPHMLPANNSSSTNFFDKVHVQPDSSVTYTEEVPNYNGNDNRNSNGYVLRRIFYRWTH